LPGAQVRHLQRGLDVEIGCDHSSPISQRPVLEILPRYIGRVHHIRVRYYPKHALVLGTEVETDVPLHKYVEVLLRRRRVVQHDRIVPHVHNDRALEPPLEIGRVRTGFDPGLQSRSPKPGPPARAGFLGPLADAHSHPRARVDDARFGYLARGERGRCSLGNSLRNRKSTCNRSPFGFAYRAAERRCLSFEIRDTARCNFESFEFCLDTWITR
jgi:hypothetical protein